MYGSIEFWGFAGLLDFLKEPFIAIQEFFLLTGRALRNIVLRPHYSDDIVSMSCSQLVAHRTVPTWEPALGVVFSDGSHIGTAVSMQHAFWGGVSFLQPARSAVFGFLAD